VGGGADVVKRLVVLVATAWVVRWAAMELAAYAGRHWQRRGPAPKDSPRQPGRMPGPFD
jgi:hypothetical protein